MISFHVVWVCSPHWYLYSQEIFLWEKCDHHEDRRCIYRLMLPRVSRGPFSQEFQQNSGQLFHCPQLWFSDLNPFLWPEGCSIQGWWHLNLPRWMDLAYRSWLLKESWMLLPEAGGMDAEQIHAAFEGLPKFFSLTYAHTWINTDTHASLKLCNYNFSIYG